MGCWVKTAKLHLKDIEDMSQHVGMLQHALPVIPNWVRAEGQNLYRKRPAQWMDAMYVDSYNDPSEHESAGSSFYDRAKEEG